MKRKAEQQMVSANADKKEKKVAHTMTYRVFM
jgi:hypothetical protein